MSEDKDKIASSTSQSNKEKRKRRHHIVLPYITTPIIFVLISLIAVVPLGVFGMNFAVDSVHKLQKVYTIDYGDIKLEEREYKASDITKGSVVIKDVMPFQKFGKITCASAGLDTDVYYGINRVSLRNGAAASSDGALPGMGSIISVFGYSSNAFKSLKFVGVGDDIVFETNYGLFTYKVYDIVKSDKFTENKISSEQLVLSCNGSGKAFSNFGSDRLFVYAKLVSGPSAEEVSRNE